MMNRAHSPHYTLRSPVIQKVVQPDSATTARSRRTSVAYETRFLNSLAVDFRRPDSSIEPGYAFRLRGKCARIRKRIATATTAARFPQIFHGGSLNGEG
jgi:hypothetical protein